MERALPSALKFLALPYNCDGLMAGLWALREKLAAAELARLRGIGQREYLVIQPLARLPPSQWSAGPPKP